MIETSCLSKVRVLLFNTSFWTIQRILILLKWCGKYLWILKSLVHPQLWILFLVFSHLFSVPWGLIVILVKFVLMFVRKKVFARQHRNTVKSFFSPFNYNKIFLDILTHQILRYPKSKSKMALDSSKCLIGPIKVNQKMVFFGFEIWKPWKWNISFG